MLYLDYESASECDLLAKGSWNYARHSTTRMLCAAYAFDDEEVQLWWGNEPAPQRLADYFKSGGQIRCHNEEFDRLLTWYVVCPDYGLAEPALERWYCTAAQARSNCAPGSLEDVGRFASSDMKKDHRGAQLIRKCCIPPFKHTLQDLIDLGEYAKQDVRTMRAVSQSMRELSDEELLDYHVNAKINMRGVLVDVDLCRAAVKYASDELTEIEAIVAEVTNGEITSVRSPKMREWVWQRVGPEARKLMQVEDKVSIDKTVRANLLTLNPDQVPHDVAEVIQCADDLWASSVAKFKRLADLADEEDRRVRGAFVFAGGSATGRYSSYGAQLHNMSRKCAKEPEEVRQAMVRGHRITPKFGKRATDVLKGMLRPAITVEPGRKLIAFDWAAIEARVLPWLSAAPSAEDTLDVFRSGKDIYISTAAAMFNKDESEVTKDDRMLGKVSVLACGFSGGVGAFASMGRIYGVNLPESDAKRMVNLWRRSNPWAPKFWQDLESAMLRAMRNPGYEFQAGRITYLKQGDHLWYALPSGRVLCYPYARFEADGSVSFSKASWKPAADAKEWPRARVWVGLQAENCTQAAANCILRYAMREMDAAGIQVTGSVHDEIIAECDERDAEAVYQKMEKIMCTSPAWASGLPLNVEGSVMTRYSK